MNKQEFIEFAQSLPDDIEVSADKIDAYFDASSTEFVLGGESIKLAGHRVKYAVVRIERRIEVNEEFSE